MKTRTHTQNSLALFALFAIFLATIQAAEKATGPRFEKEIAAYEAADAKSMPPTGAILFIGSSSIRKWTTLKTDFADYTVINRGFGGSFISDSVNVANRIVIPYKPKLIVIHAGGNDIEAGKTPEQLCTDFQNFVEKVRAALPDTRIAYMSMSPQPKRWAHEAKCKKVNELISAYVKAGKNLDFIDLWDAMLDKEGNPRTELFVADGIHNNAEGYKVRIALTAPHLKGFETSTAK